MGNQASQDRTWQVRTIIHGSTFRICRVTGPGHAIACNRPFEHNTLPLALLHNAFGIFKDRCKEAPSERALTFPGKLTAETCKWYQDETKQRSAIQSVFEEHLGIRFHQKVPNTESTTDGNLMVIGYCHACRNPKMQGSCSKPSYPKLPPISIRSAHRPSSLL